MNQEQESVAQEPEIKLYRCGCRPCDEAEEELTRLSKLYKVKITIKRVEKEPDMEQYAGFYTPMVYVNGQQISHYTMSIAKWEAAIKDAPASFTRLKEKNHDQRTT